MITKTKWKKCLEELKWYVDHGLTMTLDGHKVYSHSFDIDNLAIRVNKGSIVFKHPDSFSNFTRLVDLKKRFCYYIRYDEQHMMNKLFESYTKMSRPKNML